MHVPAYSSPDPLAGLQSKNGEWGGETRPRHVWSIRIRACDRLMSELYKLVRIRRLTSDCVHKPVSFDWGSEDWTSVRGSGTSPFVDTAASTRTASVGVTDVIARVSGVAWTSLSSSEVVAELAVSFEADDVNKGVVVLVGNAVRQKSQWFRFKQVSSVMASSSSCYHHYRQNCQAYNYVNR